MKVDVVVPTFNSSRTLDRCLSSITRNVPLQNLFVIDSNSQDTTREIARQHNAIIVKSSFSLAFSRMLGFKLVTTQIFASVDSDIVLPDNWFKQLIPHLKEDVGCVWGITQDSDPLYRIYRIAMYRRRDPTKIGIPYVPNMLARREALSNIKFPNALLNGSVAGEDYWIYHWIKDVKHLKTITAPIYVLHLRESHLGRKTFWCAAGNRVIHRHRTRRMVWNVLLAFFQGLYASLVSGEPRVLPYWMRYRAEELYGWLNWSRYV